MIEEEFCQFCTDNNVDAHLVGISLELPRETLINIKKNTQYIIFSYEWIERKTQVKGYLKEAPFSMRASKCDLIEITKEIANNFYEQFHIQGRTSNNIVKSVGMFYKNEMIAAMSFSEHHRQGHEDNIVLSRMCFHHDYKIYGGASRMLKFLVKMFPEKRIISWSDNRWSEGKVYEAIGFQKEDELAPDYFYVKNDKVFSKQSMTKKKIGAKEGQTEYERAKELGFHRIWDCGKTRWVLSEEYLKNIKFDDVKVLKDVGLGEFF